MKSNQTLSKRKIRIKHVLFIGAALLIIIMLCGWTVFRVLISKQDIGQLEVPLPAATILYDQNGVEATRISFNKIEEIGYAEIPRHMVDAVVAVEDRRYFEHAGMDMRAIGRAFWANISSGGTVQGGSTITQQLAKNVFLSHERTWSRKWDEVLLAKKIEENYNKEDIMGMYLNQIYYGEGAWGINRAASKYFGKKPSELTVAEAALLAGLIKAPSALTPYKHLDKAVNRRNIVLQLMKDQALISEDIYKKAIQEPVQLLSSKPNRLDDINYPYYVDQIIREATEQYGLSENEVLQGGLRIYTALDMKMQQSVERIYAKEELFPNSAADQLIQSSAILIDPRDGGIRALVGGRGEQPFRGFNRATQLKRQPGSTIKPIAVYTPALELGYKPTNELIDEPINIGGYEPRNADGAFHGRVSLYEALIQSYNIPAVKLLNEIGIDKGMDAAKRFGIPLTNEDRTLGLALGGLHDGVSPMHMAEAFGVFANDGVRHKAHAITRIESADGQVLAEFNQSEGSEKVTEPETARTMTAMLEGVIKDGTGRSAELKGRPLAGKSGTTQMQGMTGYAAKDNWFVGYTPQLVGSVWLGYDKSDSNHYLSTSSKAAQVVFQAVFTEALKDEPVIAFPKAPDLLPKKKLKEKDDKSSLNDDSKSNRDWKKEKEDRKERKEREKDRKKEKDRDKEKEKDRDKDRGNGRDREKDNKRNKDNDDD